LSIDNLKEINHKNDKYYSLSSWFNPFLLSGEVLKEEKAWFVKLKLADSVEDTDPDRDECIAYIDTWNEKSKTLGYSCYTDAVNVGGKVAETYINKSEFS